MKKIVTIAGSDSCGGAGIQADLKTITVMGAYGLSVITALTAQNTQGVSGIHPVPTDFIASQWDAILSDIPIDAVKTGMLWDKDVIELVSGKLKANPVPIKVFDPVMVSKSGAQLLTKAGRAAFIEKLLPSATIVTPNIPEARILCGRPIRTVQDMDKAARRINTMGAQSVLIKGGHRRGAAVDVLFDGKKIFHFYTPRIKTVHTHGTGCTFASAIAVELTRNDSIAEAVEKAKRFITDAIAHAFPLGKGQGPTNPYAPLERKAGIYDATQSLRESLRILQSNKAGHLIPEVQSNLGYALPEATSHDDVVAFPGRIIRFKDTVIAPGIPEPGASRHIANIILTVMHFDPRYRAAMNIRYSSDILRACRRQKWKTKTFDRKKEPRRIKRKEGSSLEWGVGSVLEKSASVPDAIYDLGDVGKEPMIRILGESPQEVVNKVLCLL
jgi:hydroxymethylpyrimidine/phosphomethylpyrimidine kinase